jgi:proton-dependent oligopeptide transporter, POT family
MLKNHPKGLMPLFFTETWERFGFYGMRALLTLYMIGAVANGGLGWSNGASLTVYAYYLGMAYFTTILGGWVADRFWGQRRSVVVGGLMMAAGYFLLAVRSNEAFFAGLSLVALGNGFFKPCLTSILGCLYKKDSPYRDSGYAIFYMGINLGGFIAPLVCGFFQETIGFGVGFIVAGVGMLIGLATFLRGQQKGHFKDAGLKPEKASKASKAEKPLTALEKSRLVVVCVWSLLTIAFFMAFEQAGGLLAVYAQDYTRRFILGFEVNAAFFQTLNPLFIILFGPIVSYIWAKSGELSLTVKFAIGFFLSAIAFGCMMLAASEYHTTGSSHMVWLVLFNLFVTVGELCITPVLWSNVSKITPTRYLSFMMAVTLACVGVGSYLAGFVGSFVETLTTMQIFSGIGITMLALSVISLALNAKLRSMVAGQKKKLSKPAAA